MSRTDDVVDGIKHMILSGELRPGQRLPAEKELAEALGVSRGSLREGVRALSILGVLDTRQGDGTYVTGLEVARLLAPMGFLVDLHGTGRAGHVHALRRLLEGEAARLAATRITAPALADAGTLLGGADRYLDGGPGAHERLMEIDIAFHRAVAATTGDPVLIGMIETLASRTVRERLWRGLHEEGALRRTHEEHLAIWRALEARDSDAARIRMTNHLLGVEESLRRLRGDGPAPDPAPDAGAGIEEGVAD